MEANNSEFIDHLTDKGFYVASQSHSNYASTELSIASSLNMEYINYLSENIGIKSKNYMLLGKMIKNNKVMRFLKSKGYKFVHFSSGWVVTKHNPYADLEFSFTDITEFSVLLLQTSILRPFLKHFILNDVRGAILHTFDKIAEVPEIKDPTFVFAHILTPHENIPPPHEYLFGDTYQDQLPIINKKLLTLAEAILSKSNFPPIIIFQSDHGTAFTGEFEQPTEKFIRERMSILNAYYLPADGKMLLYESITPVNSFRLIFMHYLGANFDLLGDYSYFSDYEHPYKFTDVTNMLTKEYTPTHCQDRKLGFLRWIHHRLLKQLERREPEGRPECQLLRRTPRLGCGSPKPGVIADYYKVQNTG